MAAAGARLRCTVPECRWFTGAALTPEQQTHQLARHLRDVHAPRPSVTFDGDTWDEVREAARAWLAEEDARIPTQRPGQEGTS